MLGRLFGRGKDDTDEAVCARCGRTLLAGELTQRVTDDDGTERLLCSLCAQDVPATGGERQEVSNGSANAIRVPSRDEGVAEPGKGRDYDRVEAPRSDSDALWKAIKDRDAQIERLEEQLARGEAERQELLGRLARAEALAASGEDAPAQPTGIPAAGAAVAGTPPTGEVVTADDTTTPTEPSGADAEPAVAAASAAAFEEPDANAAPEDTAEIAAAEVAGADTAELEAAAAAARAVTAMATGADTGGGAAAIDGEESGPAGEIVAPDMAEKLTLLQRGVDLLNVSPVPRKIAETNQDLGIPSVHAGFDGETVAITFMWSMGWYRFDVDVESGRVGLGDRGYDERGDLQPNASVRADGTVQLAAARISRAAAEREHAAAGRETVPETVPETTTETSAPETGDSGPAPAAPPGGGPEILSKSLLGQRTDDEKPTWESTEARDFDWDR